MSAATDLERLFKAGITAYQAGEYERAIVSFSKLSRAKSRSYQAKANMGLVRVYMAQQEWAKAKILCERVGKSSNPTVQQWSEKTLAKIVRRSGEAIRVENAASVKSRSSSGFQLIDADLAQPLPAQPLSEQPASVSVQNVPPQTNNQSKPAPATPKDSPVSMFHYSYLNGDGDVSDDSLNDDKSDSAHETELDWIYAGRLPQGKSLGKIKRGQLRFMQLGGAIAFYYFWRMLIVQIVDWINNFLSFLDKILPFWVRSLPSSWQTSHWPLLISLMTIIIGSPWLWDYWLRLSADRHPCSAAFLRKHSAESAKLINRHCRQQGWSFPTLWMLPTDIPLIFSYGWLPRNARLVFSQGLLTQLNDDEIAALVAYEMSHWQSWHWPLLSVKGLILQVILWLYWQLSLWANRQRNWMMTYGVGVIATLLYAIFWLARIPSLGMARVRTYYSDRNASTLTGNPNGLTRALAKLSFSMADAIEQHGYTPILLEGLTPLLPVSADIARQPLYKQMPLAELFAWDYLNPLRTWMSCIDTHPPLGDRIRLLMAYAQYWKLTPEIQLLSAEKTIKQTAKKTIKSKKNRHQGLSGADWQRLITQATPYLGLALGLVLGLIFLGIGAIAKAFEWTALDWMHQDTGLFQCCLLLGFGVGTILRMNRFFPDLSFSMPLSDTTFEWICEPTLLPVDSLPAKLTGTLAGRPGVANWLGQDLFLKTSSGLVRLHYFSVLGPLGNAISFSHSLGSLMNVDSIQLLGWFRRGNRPWIDVDQIRSSRDTAVMRAAHPIYSLLFAGGASALGLWLLIRNSAYG